MFSTMQLVQKSVWKKVSFSLKLSINPIFDFRELKTYIKTLCCFPERCNIEEYEAIMADFRNSEKVRKKGLKRLMSFLRSGGLMAFACVCFEAA